MKTKIKVFTAAAIFLAMNVFMGQECAAFVGGEHWDAEAAAEGVDPSGTLPVIYINTENGQVIDQKEEYVPASAWFEAEGYADYNSLGSEEAPVALGIRGRGNASWKYFDKKPYKLKFDKKCDLLKTGKSKHYALIAFISGTCGYAPAFLGMEFGHVIIDGWTPRFRPVEVVLNGQYIGLYFLCETVKIESARLDIEEQPEGNTDPETIGNGYLVELDNYDDENQLKFTGDDPNRVTVKTPENMTEPQSSFLTSQIEAINAALYTDDKMSRDWEELIDLESYVRYYVVQEAIHNTDTFVGSTYLYRNNDIWFFGPLWDVGEGLEKQTTPGCFLWEDPSNPGWWIKETLKFPRFIKRLQEVYAEFRETYPTEHWNNYLDNFASGIREAEQQSMKVWDYYRSYPVDKQVGSTQRQLAKNLSFLDQEWAAEPLTTKVSAEKPENGKILLGGHDYSDVDLFKGDDLEVSFEPDAMYKLDKVKLDGEDVTGNIENNKLMLADVRVPHNIEASYIEATTEIQVTAVNEAMKWNITGNIVSSETSDIEIYNVAGCLIGSGKRIILPAHGVYILRNALGKVGKIIF